MTSAIDKAPRTTRVTWRGLRDDMGDPNEDRFIRWQQRIGTDIKWHAWSSATIDPEVANRFAGGNYQQGVVFEIRSNRGRYVAPISVYQGDESEEEVLFPPGSKFRVVDVRYAELETRVGLRERILIILDDITDD